MIELPCASTESKSERMREAVIARNARMPEVSRAFDPSWHDYSPLGMSLPSSVVPHHTAARMLSADLIPSARIST